MLTILEIHRMSIHNGPGIRTMVHLKGCPLQCIWCSTPDSQTFQPQLGAFPQKCIGCGRCLPVCPEGAVTWAGGGITATDWGRCSNCLRCTQVCGADARKQLGTPWSAGRLRKELLKDQIFFETSGGGVVFSGGEVMAWVDGEFLELMEELRRDGVSIGLDTCGYAPQERFDQVLPLTDYFLWDIKQMDPQRHQEFTGVDNSLILDNLIHVDGQGADIYLRCPMIPGFTDDRENLEQICVLAARLRHLREIHLLPFHHMGTARYHSIGREDPLERTALLAAEQMQAKLQYILDQGFPARIVG